ncbi:MAG: hypothetical protein ACYCWN_06305 [Ferrimicrobium sp.]|jgi:hypothetical protein|uniref:Uncharacterized protein n=1 Tax=Ferrimicrobium acidiphilum TaxID=121039 RepID=A0ABV3Y563_9ACTN|nr:hypothetical protein [Ferrimicrobium sp.]
MFLVTATDPRSSKYKIAGEKTIRAALMPAVTTSKQIALDGSPDYMFGNRFGIFPRSTFSSVE